MQNGNTIFNLENKVRMQIGVNAGNGVHEVFVNHDDYYTYYGLGKSNTPNMNQKMFAVVFNNEVEMICLEFGRAMREFKGICEEEGINYIS